MKNSVETPIDNKEFGAFCAFVKSDNYQKFQILLGEFICGVSCSDDIDKYHRLFKESAKEQEDSLDADSVLYKIGLAKRYVFLKNECTIEKAMQLINDFVSNNEFWGAQGKKATGFSVPKGIGLLRRSFENHDIPSIVILEHIKTIITARGKKKKSQTSLFAAHSGRSESTVNFYKSIEQANNWQDLCCSVLLSDPALGMSCVFDKAVQTSYQAEVDARRPKK